MTDAGVTFKAKEGEGMPEGEKPEEEKPAPPMDEKQEPPMPPAAEGEEMDEGAMLAQLAQSIATLQAQMTALMEALAPAQAEAQASKAARETLATQVAPLTVQVKALQITDDEKIARALNPRIAPAATGAIAQGVSTTDAAAAAIADAKTLGENQYSWLKTVKIV